MLLVSVPNQMPKLCVAALAVNSATSVGMLVAKLGVVDVKRRRRALAVVDVDVAGAERRVGDRLQALLAGYGAPITEGAGLFGANGSATAPMLAVSPSSATIDFNFIYNSRGGSAPKT